MADLFSLQQPPPKKFRSGPNTNETGSFEPLIKTFTGHSSSSSSLDFELKMFSQYDTSDTNTSADLFDMTADFPDPLDNSQASMQTSTSTNPQPPSGQNPFPTRLSYMPQPRPQLQPYQTPNLQRIQTMPTATIIRSANVIQPQSSMYTPQQQQQMMNTSRPVYPRMSTLPQQPQAQQTMSAQLIRQPYNSSGMVAMPQNVTQMNIVKASDPNNNSVFVTNPQQQQQQQQPTLIGLQSQHTVTQTNKPITKALPSLNPQQLSQFQVQMQAPNPMQPYNIGVCQMSEAILILFFLLLFSCSRP